jgi:hypothetical protein
MEEAEDQAPDILRRAEIVFVKLGVQKRRKQGQYHVSGELASATKSIPHYLFLLSTVRRRCTNNLPRPMQE